MHCTYLKVNVTDFFNISCMLQKLQIYIQSLLNYNYVSYRTI